jgi:hypothetical protein
MEKSLLVKQKDLVNYLADAIDDELWLKTDDRADYLSSLLDKSDFISFDSKPFPNLKLIS